MKKLLLLLLVVAAFAANSLMTSGVPYMTHPQPPSGWEFYWDDGIMVSGWAWYTGGNYWAVQFDEEKTGGEIWADVYKYGAVTYPSWPNSTYEGVYMHTFDDQGGYPGTDLDRTYFPFTTGGIYEWINCDVFLGTYVFYIAFEQYGNYPVCDSMGVDAVAGTHDWTGYNGSWGQTTDFGDFMLRCYWSPYGDIEETSWGAVKALY